MRNLNILLVIFNLLIIYLIWNQTITYPIIKTSSIISKLISFYYILNVFIFNTLLVILYFSIDIEINKFIEQDLSNMIIINIFNFSLILFNYIYTYIKYKYYQVDLNTNSNQINYIVKNKKKNLLNLKRLSTDCINDIQQILVNCDDRQKRLLIRTVNKYLN